MAKTENGGEAEAGMSLGDGEEACSKGFACGIVGGLLKAGGLRLAPGRPRNQVKGPRHHVTTTRARSTAISHLFLLYFCIQVTVGKVSPTPGLQRIAFRACSV